MQDGAAIHIGWIQREDLVGSMIGCPHCLMLGQRVQEAWCLGTLPREEESRLQRHAAIDPTRRGPVGVRNTNERWLSPARARAYSESATAPRGVSNSTSMRTGNAASAFQSDTALLAMSASRASSTTRSRSLEAVTVGFPEASSNPTLPAGPHSLASPCPRMIPSMCGKTARAATARVGVHEANAWGVASSNTTPKKSHTTKHKLRKSPRTPTGNN